MADTQIEWTDSTWNPVAGCSIITAGCTHCYAMEMASNRCSRRRYICSRVIRGHRTHLFELLQNGALNVAFRIEEHVGTLRKLLQKYRDTPMSLADACVVRMAEIHERHAVLTLDSDFSVYRKHGRVPLTLIRPAAPD